MNAPHNDEPWLERASALLDRSTENLDAATLSRLTRARHLALAEAPSARRRWMIGTAFVGAAAAVFALAVGLHRFSGEIVPPASTPLQDADIDFATSDDDALDLYENLDFYAWLETQPGDVNG